jgi:hypothetical protein
MSLKSFIIDDVGDFIVGVAESFDWFVRQHPFLAMLLFVILFFGGCEVAVKVHIVSSQTKLMPY